MATCGKRYTANLEKAGAKKDYPLGEAAALLKEMKPAKYDETIGVSIRMGIDSRKADQQVRTTVVLPHGTGKKVRVLVFAKGDKEKEAQAAGADFVGSADLVEKITGGWLEFDVAIATPDMMRDVGKLGKILGVKGLMPNPKAGTVTTDLTRTIGELRKGRVELKVDKTNIVHSVIGKFSFTAAQLAENLTALLQALMRAKPASVAGRGAYLKRITISTTHGPGLTIDPRDLWEKLEG